MGANTKNPQKKQKQNYITRLNYGSAVKIKERQNGELFQSIADASCFSASFFLVP